MKVYYFIGRLLRPFAFISFRIYSYVFRTPRTRVVLCNERGELLLIQTWLGGDSWCFPGGGAERGEPADLGALRELQEETGITVGSDMLKCLFTLRSAGHDEIVFFATVAKSDLPEKLPSKFEVKRAEWFSAEELPSLQPLAQEIIDRMAM